MSATQSPPDPTPFRPARHPPPGACDSHCHIYGPFTRFPLPPDRSFTPPEAPEAALRRLHEHLGIDRAGIVQSQGHAFDQRPLLDALEIGQGRYLGVALVRAETGDAEIAALDAAEVCGARFSFLSHLGGRSSPDLIRCTAASVRPHGWHIAMPKLSGSDRISLAGSPYHDVVPFAAALAAHAPERVSWGSDWPHVNISGPMPDDGVLADLIDLITPSAAARQQMLVDNPVTFFGFAQ